MCPSSVDPFLETRLLSLCLTTDNSPSLPKSEKSELQALAVGTLTAISGLRSCQALRTSAKHQVAFVLPLSASKRSIKCTGISRPDPITNSILEHKSRRFHPHAGRASVNLEEALESRRHLGLAPAAIALLRSAEGFGKTPARGSAALAPLPEEGAPAAGRADVSSDADTSSIGSADVAPADAETPVEPVDEEERPAGRADVAVAERAQSDVPADVMTVEEGAEEADVDEGPAWKDQHDVIAEPEGTGSEGPAAGEETSAENASGSNNATGVDDVSMTVGFDVARLEIAAAVGRWAPSPVEKEQVGPNALVLDVCLPYPHFDLVSTPAPCYSRRGLWTAVEPLANGCCLWASSICVLLVA